MIVEPFNQCPLVEIQSFAELDVLRAGTVLAETQQRRTADVKRISDLIGIEPLFVINL